MIAVILGATASSSSSSGVLADLGLTARYGCVGFSSEGEERFLAERVLRRGASSQTSITSSFSSCGDGVVSTAVVTDTDLSEPTIVPEVCELERWRRGRVADMDCRETTEDFDADDRDVGVGMADGVLRVTRIGGGDGEDTWRGVVCAVLVEATALRLG